MKSKFVAALLAFFVGGLGIHKFYLGKPGWGILYLIFCWTFVPAIIAFIEAIIFLCMSEADFNRKYNEKYLSQNQRQSSFRDNSYPTNRPLYHSNDDQGKNIFNYGKSTRNSDSRR